MGADCLEVEFEDFVDADVAALVVGRVDLDGHVAPQEPGISVYRAVGHVESLTTDLDSGGDEAAGQELLGELSCVCLVHGFPTFGSQNDLLQFRSGAIRAAT